MVKRENYQENPLYFLQFQRFLFAENLGERSKTPIRPRSFPGHDKPFIDEMWNILRRRKGYLVSTGETSQNLYGTQERSDLEAVVGTMNYIKNRLGPVSRQRMIVKVVGSAIGVKSFMISDNEELQALYALWQNPDKFISASDFAALADQQTDQLAVNRAVVRLDNLVKLPFKNAKIETAKFFDQRKYYRLRLEKVEGSEKSEAVNESQTESGIIFGREFQDWMRKEKVLQLHEPYRGLILKNKKLASDRQRRLVKLLADNYGYVFDWESVANAYFGNSKPENWRRKLSADIYALRRSLRYPEAITPLVDFGYSHGVNKVRVRRLTINPLLKLWENMGELTPVEQITDDPKRFVARDASSIRYSLRDSGFELGSDRGPSGLRYILIGEDGFARVA